MSDSRNQSTSTPIWPLFSASMTRNGKCLRSGSSNVPSNCGSSNDTIVYCLACLRATLRFFGADAAIILVTPFRKEHVTPIDCCWRTCPPRGVTPRTGRQSVIHPMGRQCHQCRHQIPNHPPRQVQALDLVLVAVLVSRAVFHV